MKKPELKKDLCSHCGDKTEFKIISGSMSRDPKWGVGPGRKGIDTSYFAHICPQHGEVQAIASPETQAEHQAAVIEYEAWQEWIDSLPDQIDDETLIDKHQGIITDPIGNYLMSLPQQPVANLTKYFRDNFEIPE